MDIGTEVIQDQLTDTPNTSIVTSGVSSRTDTPDVGGTNESRQEEMRCLMNPNYNNP